MFNIRHYITKGDGNFFRVLEPTTEQGKNDSNNAVNQERQEQQQEQQQEQEQEKQQEQESKEDADNKETDVVVVTPEITRQILVDKCGEHDWLYADWNVRDILPSPMRLVMFRPSMCQLCGIVDDSIQHDQFYSGYVYEHTGFNYCYNCKDKFFSALKARAEPIWELLQCETLRDFWGPRTRRDPITNGRMYSGKYKYEKWRAVSRYASYSVDNTKGLPGVENVLFIYCEMKDTIVGEITKLISVSDILKSNYNACKNGFFDPSYDPNDDDPMNTLELSDDAKIVLSKVQVVQQ
jgi:hypothetical protein